MYSRRTHVLLACILIAILCGSIKLYTDISDGWSIHAPAHGSVLGEFDGVNIYAPGAYDARGTYGIEFECVEYINRFYSHKLSFKNMTQTGHADSYFWHAKEKGLTAFPNGSSTPPRKYDILVFDRGNNDGVPGHVAIVTHVDLVRGTIDVAQQNTVAKRYGGLLKKSIPKESFRIEQHAQGEWFVLTQPNRLPVAGWSRERSSP